MNKKTRSLVVQIIVAVLVFGALIMIQWPLIVRDWNHVVEWWSR